MIEKIKLMKKVYENLHGYPCDTETAKRFVKSKKYIFDKEDILEYIEAINEGAVGEYMSDFIFFDGVNTETPEDVLKFGLSTGKIFKVGKWYAFSGYLED